jgi:hypothetical protein
MCKAAGFDQGAIGRSGGQHASLSDMGLCLLLVAYKYPTLLTHSQ